MTSTIGRGLEAQPATPESGRAPSGRVTLGLVLRSLAVGVASGARATCGPVAAALAGGHRRAALISTGLALTELTVDKLPATPSRLQAGPLLGRGASGSVGALALARREDALVFVPVMAGLVGAGAGSVVGAAWREYSSDRGWTWRGAVAEDVVALALTAYAVRR